MTNVRYMDEEKKTDGTIIKPSLSYLNSTTIWWGLKGQKEGQSEIVLIGRRENAEDFIAIGPEEGV